MTTLTLHLPRPHAAQFTVLQEAARFNVLDMGRRWGKSTLLQNVVIKPALEGFPVGWFAPNYKYLTEAWRDIKRILQPITRRSNASEHRIELITNGVVEFWTLDDPNAGRSRKYKRLVVDEAGLVKNLLDMWHTALRPTLADFVGDAWFAGTPKGRNDFWQLWLLGQSDDTDWQSWQMPTATNPFIAPSEIEAMRDGMPELLYAQEIEAEFIEDTLTLFRLTDIERAEQGASNEQGRLEGHTYLTSVDIGRRQDATVINTFDTTKEPYQRVAFERLERVPYPIIQQHIEQRWRQYGGRLVIESNGVGDPVIENLSVPAESFVTSSKTKTQAIQALQLLLEQGTLKAKWEQREKAELIKAAWDDDHTADEIMSLAIGAMQLSQPPAIATGKSVNLWQRR